MAKTIKELAVMVLEEIGRLPDGQVAPASQIKKVTDKYDGVYAELLSDGLVSWASDDDIPDFAVDSLMFILAGRVATQFGVPNEWRRFESNSKLSLSSQIANPYTAQTTQFEDI